MHALLDIKLMEKEEKEANQVIIVMRESKTEQLFVLPGSKIF